MPITMEEDFGIFEVGVDDLFTPPIDPARVVRRRMRFGEQVWAQTGRPFAMQYGQREEYELQREMSAWQAAGLEALQCTLDTLSE
jgi:hypothetical protein